MKVSVQKITLDNGLVFVLKGGKSHIGCVAVAEPGEETKVTKFDGHKDHVVAVPFAEEVSKIYKTRIVCISGIHYDDITEKEIEEVKEECRRLASCC